MADGDADTRTGAGSDAASLTTVKEDPKLASLWPAVSVAGSAIAISTVEPLRNGRSGLKRKLRPSELVVDPVATTPSTVICNPRLTDPESMACVNCSSTA